MGLLGTGFGKTIQSYAVELTEGDSTRPPSRKELENIPKLNVLISEESGVPFDIRREAMREGGLSYGARGGLSWRTFHIRKEMERRASFMDKVYDFRNLMIPAPSGLLIEPPVISESVNALIVEKGGQEAAVADRVYRLNKNARLVSTPRTWRNYLERDWGEVVAPPDVLLPNNAEERKAWIDWIREGWKQGIDQANDVFQEDLNLLMSDYLGMLRYRMLLAQDMISPPYALQVDRGVTGVGNVMRVGDRAVEITGKPGFIIGSERWYPASR